MEAKRALRLTGPESPPDGLSKSIGGGGPGGGGAGAPPLGAAPEAEATGPCETKITDLHNVTCKVSAKDG